MATDYKRTRFFVDKEIQGRYMVSLLIPMSVMFLLFSLLLLFSLKQGVATTVSNIEEGIKEQIALSLQRNENPSAREYKNLLVDVEDQLSRYRGSDLHRSDMIKSILLLIVPGFLVLIAQLILLTIFFSHKLAGPVYRLELACKRVIDGDYTEEVNLREGDQLTRLASLFNQMIALSKIRIQTLSEEGKMGQKEKILKKIKI